MCIAILRVHREPSSTAGTAVRPAPCAQLLPGHEKRRSVVVPNSQSFCSCAITNWDFELLVVEQTRGEEQGSLCNWQCHLSQQSVICSQHSKSNCYFKAHCIACSQLIFT